LAVLRTIDPTTRARVRAPLGVAGARLRAHPLRFALVVAGVALAFAMLVAVLGGSLVARQQALAQSLATLPSVDRGFRIDRFGYPLDAGDFARADRRARRALAPLSDQPVRRAVLFRELRVQGELVELAAVDGLSGAVDLRTGALPRRCTAASCELLQIGAGGPARLSEGGIRLQRTGVASLRNPRLFGDVSAAGGVGEDRPRLLLAPSVRSLLALDALSSFYRVYSWISPLRVDGLRTWDVPTVLARESRAQSLLATDPAFRFSGPDQALLDASSRGRIAAQRLVLVGGETSAVLLFFVVVAALGLRRGRAAERRRLLARGARRWQVAVGVASELTALTTLGAVVGLAAGAVVVAAVAGAASLPPGALLAHTMLTPTTWALLACAWAATTLVLALATFTRERESVLSRVGTVDVAALGALAVIGVAVGRGALDPTSVDTGTAWLLVAMPILISFVVAVALARVLGPAMRAAERLTRGRNVTLRLAVLALARAPSRTVAACAFVATALGLALFAVTYRATLQQGAADQASYQVPLDFVASEGSRLVQPLDAAPLSRFAAIAPGTRAYPVLRSSATTAGAGAAVTSVTVLGLPPAAVRELHWRPDYSSSSQTAVAEQLARGGGRRLTGPALPAGPSRLSLRVRVRGIDVRLALVVADRSGRTRSVPLGHVEQGGHVVSARVDGGAGLRVTGLQLTLPTVDQFFLAHREAEGSIASPPSGTLDLDPLHLAGGGVVTGWEGWLLKGGGRVAHAAGAAARLRFAFQDTGGTLLLRPRQPTDGHALPVVVSPDIAAAAGGTGSRIVLDFQDVQVPAVIRATAKRFPGIPADAGSFAVAGGTSLSTAVDADAPGEGTPGEVWIAADHPAAAARALRRAPFSSLVVTSRGSLERELAGDRLAHATAVALLAGALVALVLAAIGFWIGVLSELRDERSDFFDLEAQGLPPERLRAQLRVRASIVVGLALCGGIALGLVLARLVVSFVHVSASTALPEPPLRLDPAWPEALGVVAAIAVIALAVAELTSLRSFRAARPERASWSLE
jgi:hypothetical protein